MVEISQRADSWDDLPFNTVIGSAHHSGDSAPKRTNNGDFIFFHGTSLSNAKRIIADKEIKRDDLGYSGVGTNKHAVSVFGTLKAMKANSTANLKHHDPNAERSAILRVVISRDWFKDRPDSVNREVGGLGRDQFLIRPKHGESGVPLVKAELVRVGGEDL